MRNEIPLSEKHQTIPNAASVTPASQGPTTRARLNWMELSATAFGRSRFSTKVGTSACDAGAPNACADPVIKESTRICQM
jgi:hypothetical protein